MTAASLASRLRPPGPMCAPLGPVLRLFDEADLPTSATKARKALEPMLEASPYLASISRRWPAMLGAVLEDDPEVRLGDILERARTLSGGAEVVRSPLRLLKAELHLLTALCDLGGVWPLEAVTGALSRFADVAVQAGLAAVAADAVEAGRLAAGAACAEDGPIPGLFILAMGKHGAGELNYSSDIDISVFYEPERLSAALAAHVEAQAFADRAAGALARLLSERTGDGYVFRVDLRLRPDPSSTPPAVPAPAALTYYETVGQNWERAAFIKARALAGDMAAAQAFLAELRPFVWRRSLDYGAIADVHSIKRQIHVHKADERAEAAGANLKLGRGGIREIEFYAQTQQLILGGRDPSLRAVGTLDALEALSRRGHVSSDAQSDLSAAYERLRCWEHRIQMLNDEQTHILPEDPAARAAVAALAGASGLEAFDAEVSGVLARVNARYGELFAGDEALSSEYGSLVFTGVENDPETLQTLARMGFSDPGDVSATIRAWHHGRIGATRSARGRELFTRLAPRLLDACARTGAADTAFRRFAHFFERLRAGVQVQALFLAQPGLFEMIVETLAYSQRLADTLARQSSALDAVVDGSFFAPLDADSGVLNVIETEARAAPDFEGAMNRVRAIHREQAFRISLQILNGAPTPDVSGAAFTALAEACVRGLAEAALREVERAAGAMPGQVAVVALGKAGSREMSAASDLDLMTLYSAPPGAESGRRGWSADVWYGRFTQRLIAALSAHTAEGGLYEVDMRLRPSGTSGPVAVSLSAFEDYYAREADTWEFLALTRARVIWSNDPAFAQTAAAAVEAALRRPRDRTAVLHDAAAMRALMARERPAWGDWDVKRAEGGLIDCEFAAQALQLVSASDGGPLQTNTLSALQALREEGRLTEEEAEALSESWRLHQALAQMMRAAMERRTDPALEPPTFQARLAALGGKSTLAELADHLKGVRVRARRAYETVMSDATD